MKNVNEIISNALETRRVECLKDLNDLLKSNNYDIMIEGDEVVAIRGTEKHFSFRAMAAMGRALNKLEDNTTIINNETFDGSEMTQVIKAVIGLSLTHDEANKLVDILVQLMWNRY